MRYMADYVVIPEKIEKHSFYPFIHYKMKMDKYSSKKGRVQKERDIYYASHRDRCVFQYYAHLINEKYNQYVYNLGIDKVAVAYRNNLHENNIISSKRAFDYIKALGNSYVMIGDFKNFFDRLNHAYLKKQLTLVLGTDVLSKDYYAVYKNVTRYAYVDIADILRINRLNDNKEGRRKLNKKKTVLTQEQFEEHRHDIVHKNEDKYGIPQGSPISAVLANVYMVTADKIINDYVTKFNGFYMRYSDDFIVIIPYEEDYKAVFEYIRDLLDGVPDLILEPNKTQIFSVEDGHIQNIGSEILEDADCSKNDINFLGFTFNGKTITLRAKTVGKYYYRMHRKAKYAHRHSRKKILYKRYSERGSYGSEGNFFSYVRNAEKVYGDNEDIRHDLKNDMAKIRRAIQMSEE